MENVLSMASNDNVAHLLLQSYLLQTLDLCQSPSLLKICQKQQVEQGEESTNKRVILSPIEDDNEFRVVPNLSSTTIIYESSYTHLEEPNLNLSFNNLEGTMITTPTQKQLMQSPTTPVQTIPVGLSPRSNLNEHLAFVAMQNNTPLALNNPLLTTPAHYNINQSYNDGEEIPIIKSILNSMQRKREVQLGGGIRKKAEKRNWFSRSTSRGNIVGGK